MQQDLVDAYPGELRELLEWSLAHRDDLTACFRHRDEAGILLAAVRTLGRVGDESTARLLRSVIDDQRLGAAAASAIRTIHERPR